MLEGKGAARIKCTSTRRQSSAWLCEQQSAELREKEAEAMATRHQCSEFREREWYGLWLVSARPLTSEGAETWAMLLLKVPVF